MNVSLTMNVRMYGPEPAASLNLAQQEKDMFCDEVRSLTSIRVTVNRSRMLSQSHVTLVRGQQLFYLVQMCSIEGYFVFLTNHVHLLVCALVIAFT